jgi:hypothetical protein
VADTIIQGERTALGPEQFRHYGQGPGGEFPIIAAVPIPVTHSPATLLYQTAAGVFDHNASVAAAVGQVNMAYLKLSSTAAASRWLLVFAGTTDPPPVGTHPIARSAFAVPPGGTFTWEPPRGATRAAVVPFPGGFLFAVSNTADTYTDPGALITELDVSVYGI